MVHIYTAVTQPIAHPLKTLVIGIRFPARIRQFTSVYTICTIASDNKASGFAIYGYILPSQINCDPKSGLLQIRRNSRTFHRHLDKKSPTLIRSHFTLKSHMTLGLTIKVKFNSCKFNSNLTRVTI